MVGKRKDKDKDSTNELVKELDSLAPEEKEGLLAIIRAKKGTEVKPDESSFGGNGQFREPVVKDVVPIVPEQAKVIVSQMLGRLSEGLSDTILVSKVPNDILIESVIVKTRSDRRNPEYRRRHPYESFTDTLQKNLYLHLMAHGGRRVDDLLRIAELETERSHEGNIPLSYGQ